VRVPLETVSTISVLAQTVAVLAVGIGSLLEDVVLLVDSIHPFAIVLKCLVSEQNLGSLASLRNGLLQECWVVAFLTMEENHDEPGCEDEKNCHVT
jgi:hypothetical protein